MVQVLDLKFLEIPKAIAAFIIPSNDGYILVETGPYSTFPSLLSALKLHQINILDIKHVLLTHIHFDHAGAAWALAKEGATIYVHPLGSPHLISPERLYESARMIYKEQMDYLWGAMHPISPDRVVAVEDESTISIGEHHFQAIYTPGHAKHHIAWYHNSYLFSGDICGVKILNGPVVPPCPPPDIDIEAWRGSLEKILQLNPSKLMLTHYGEITNVKEHIHQLKDELNDWASWMYDAWCSKREIKEITPDFMAYTKNKLLRLGVDDDLAIKYEAANPSWMSVTGLLRYWEKKHNK